MDNKKTMKIELSGESPISPDYFYAELELPASSYEIEDAMQRARILSAHSGSADISVNECNILPELTDTRLDSASVAELNYFAARLATLGEDEITVLRAVAPRIFNEELVSMKDLINLTYGLDEVSVISGVHTDEQLGQFVIENDLNEDVSAIPESSLYLLDKAQIGKLQRERDGGVFVENMYVVAGEYELPEVYDGEHLHEDDMEKPSVFRLEIAKAPENDSDEVIGSTQWIDLPIEKLEAARIAHSLDVAHIEDCVYYVFESTIPQITDDIFGNMQDFDKLNSLAQHYLLLSPTDQVKFKAVLEAEQPQDIDAVNDIAEHYRTITKNY